MNIPGSMNISPIESATLPGFGLRLFQRVTAQVLSVTGTTAILAIEGYPIVAQLSSPEQGTALLSQPTIQFIVSKLSNQVITLKIIQNEQSIAENSESVPQKTELALRLLEQNKMPFSANNLVLARAILNQRLPLTPGLLPELLSALSALGPWGNLEANLAASLKAAGLPVTAESIKLASNQTTQISDSLGQLISILQSAGQRLPPDLLKQIHLTSKMLERLVLNVGGDTTNLTQQLKTAVAVLGQSIESSLLEQTQNTENKLPENSLLSVVRFQHALEQAGENELAKAVEKFLEDLRYHHLLNVKPDTDIGKDVWVKIGFKLLGDKSETARLRIQRDSALTPQEHSPNFNRLILQVDINAEETIEVDLHILDNQIRSLVTAPDLKWCQLAESELPSLENALKEVGYDLQETKICVGEPQPFEDLNIISGNEPLMTVNIEV